jgi:hypothetical protein
MQAPISYNKQISIMVVRGQWSRPKCSDHADVWLVFAPQAALRGGSPKLAPSRTIARARCTRADDSGSRNWLIMQFWSGPEGDGFFLLMSAP